MTALKKQAISMIYDIPNEQMGHVIEVLNGFNKTFTDKVVNHTAPVLDADVSRLVIWNEFKKYKGIVTCKVCEKAELERARDEKYADFI